ncbi:Cardiolipin synthase B [Thalassocella blandensis]|nr:Cardiolipin synthase B [Thalassocella blandensis]
MLKFNLNRRIKDGHKITLLRDGEAFFPRLHELIEQAQSEVLLETFILEEDAVGKPLKESLLRAAKRGVKILLTIDSWGSFYLPQSYKDELVAAGVKLQIYDPQPSWAKGRPKLVHRLHRKLAVIDAKYAFVGGINLCKDHLVNDNPTGKRDYVAEVSGPVVRSIRQLCLAYATKEFRRYFGLVDNLIDHEALAQQANDPHFNSKVAFVVRDNWRHRTDIEKAYLEKIKEAKKSIFIANAYIFPSYRLTRALRKAAKRGVSVKIVTQGKPDLPYTLVAAHSTYKKFVMDGVEMYEFLGRPLHGKIAAIDDQWSTIGSSNLDPWSLGSNLEANLVIEDAAVNRQIRTYVEDLIKESKRINMQWIKHRPVLGLIRDTLLYHLMRWWPAIIRCIPNERPVIQGVRHSQSDGELDRTEPSKTKDSIKRIKNTGSVIDREGKESAERTESDNAFNHRMTAGAKQ